MPFELYDTVIVFRIPDTYGPLLGMRGYISEFLQNDYVEFTYLRENTFTIGGCGAIHTKYLARDTSQDLIDGRNKIISFREEEIKQVHIKKILKKIIEDE